MKRVILIAFSVLLVSAIIFGGCGGPAEETPTTPTTPAEPEVTTIKWRFSCFIPPSDKVALITKDWIAEVEEATDGRLEIMDYWAESLVKYLGEYDAVAAGTTDISMPSCASIGPERFPLGRFGNLVFVYSDIPQVGHTVLALLDKYEEFEEEFLPTRPIWWNCVPGDCLLVSTKKPIETMEDIKGMKICSTSAEIIRGLELMEAVPVPIGTGDRYSALETGVIQGNMTDWNASVIWKIHEVTKYRTGNIAMNMNTFPTVMNIESHNKLPEDIKGIFDEITDPMEITKRHNGGFDAFSSASIKQLKEYDETVGNPPWYFLPDDERERWVDTVWPVNEEWVSEMEELGLPGESVLADAIAFAEQYKD